MGTQNRSTTRHSFLSQVHERPRTLILRPPAGEEGYGEKREGEALNRSSSAANRLLMSQLEQLTSTRTKHEKLEVA